MARHFESYRGWRRNQCIRILKLIWPGPRDNHFYYHRFNPNRVTFVGLQPIRPNKRDRSNDE